MRGQLKHFVELNSQKVELAAQYKKINMFFFHCGPAQAHTLVETQFWHGFPRLYLAQKIDC